MKILHVVSDLNLEQGGVAQGIISLTSFYKEFGVEGTVLTMDDPDQPRPGTEHLQVVALGQGKGGVFSYHPEMVPWIKANIAQFDAVIVEGLWQYPGIAVYKALQGSSVPYYVFTHGMLDPWFKQHYPLKHLKKYLYWWLAQYAVLKNAKSVLFTCEEEKVLARESFWPYKVNETVVGYGTILNEMANRSQAEDFYQLYPELRSKRLFLFLSRIHEKKGCDLLIEAFADFANDNPDLHLVMAGPDHTEWQKDLEVLAASLNITERITWTGMLKDGKKWGAIKAAEAFVLPSHQENFGIAVAEALAVGTPVLISNKVNIWREIQMMNAGLIADDTLEGTQQLLGRWLALDLDEKQAIQSNTVPCFQAKFAMKQATKNLINLIKSDIQK